MRGRVRGGKSKRRGAWAGLTIEFKSWREFRTWALSHGYRKGLQLDRIKADVGYGPHNCQWLPAVEHAIKSNAERAAPHNNTQTGDSIYDY